MADILQNPLVLKDHREYFKGREELIKGIRKLYFKKGKTLY